MTLRPASPLLNLLRPAQGGVGCGRISTLIGSNGIVGLVNTKSFDEAVAF